MWHMGVSLGGGCIAYIHDIYMTFAHDVWPQGQRSKFSNLDFIWHASVLPIDLSLSHLCITLTLISRSNCRFLYLCTGHIFVQAPVTRSEWGYPLWVFLLVFIVRSVFGTSQYGFESEPVLYPSLTDSCSWYLWLWHNLKILLNFG